MPEVPPGARPPRPPRGRRPRTGDRSRAASRRCCCRSSRSPRALRRSRAGGDRILSVALSPDLSPREEPRGLIASAPRRRSTGLGACENTVKSQWSEPGPASPCRGGSPVIEQLAKRLFVHRAKIPRALPARRYALPSSSRSAVFPRRFPTRALARAAAVGIHGLVAIGVGRPRAGARNGHAREAPAGAHRLRDRRSPPRRGEDGRRDVLSSRPSRGSRRSRPSARSVSTTTTITHASRDAEAGLRAAPSRSRVSSGSRS